MTKYIAIDGMGGSGKTYLSNILANRLKAKVYHLDDFGNDYQPFVGIPKLIKTLEDEVENLVIFEGVGVFNDCFDKFKPFKIFVNVPENIKNMRAANRDVPRKDRTADDWAIIGEIWRKAEKDYFTESIIKKADVIVGSKDGDFDIKAILEKLAIYLKKNNQCNKPTAIGSTSHPTSLE